LRHQDPVGLRPACVCRVLVHTNLTPSTVDMARLLYFGTLATLAPFAHHSATIPAVQSSVSSFLHRLSISHPYTGSWSSSNLGRLSYNPVRHQAHPTSAQAGHRHQASV